MADIDYVVCALLKDGQEPYYEDNIIGECKDCGRRIQWRPHAPMGPPRICTGCFTKKLDENPDEKHQFIVPNKVKQEVADYIKKKLN